MIVIGITGGIAAGKSFVTSELRRLGAGVLDADRIGHAILRLPPVKMAIYQRWGPLVLRPAGSRRSGRDPGPEWSHGGGESHPGLGEAGVTLDSVGRWLCQVQVDRAAVARRVFAPPPDGPRELAFLESLTHPRISAHVARRLQRWRECRRFFAAVLDAPVLYKVGWDHYCDRILFVDAPWETRWKRVALRGWSLSQLQRRQAMQPDLDEQRARADVVIDSSGDPAQTTEQIERFWQGLRQQGST